MKRRLLIAGLALGAMATFVVAKDPVLMEVGGEKVSLSEFEYLYNKNNRQQIETESLDKYVDRFVIYKQKVAAAREAGVDTTKAYKKEYENYKKDLSAPFLTDTTVNETLAKEFYNYMLEDVDLSHIMLPRPKTAADKIKFTAKLDSIRERALAGESFEDLAVKFSADRAVARNKGRLSNAKAERLPYEFVKTAWNLKNGEISKPIDSGFGMHIIQRHGSQPVSDKVLASHILILYPRGKEVTDSAKQAAMAQMQDIYSKVKQGENFEELARKHSQDPGSARNGGQLPWFTKGEMVAPFENMAFSLANGQVSEPFETAYGVHIIKKIDQKPYDSFEECKGKIIEGFARDNRVNAAKEAKINELKKKFNLVENEGLENYIKAELNAAGGYDSAFIARLKASKYNVATYKGGSVAVSDIAKYLKPNKKLEASDAFEQIKNYAAKEEEKAVTNAYLDELEKTNPAYANLLKEYRDGMMLFEISDRRVWSAAGKDTDGLTAYFEANRAKYNWNEPKFKGMVLSARTDSVLQEVKAKIDGKTDEEAIALIHKEYRNKAKIERILAAKGENPVADKEAFKIPVKKKDNKMPFGLILSGKIIDQPEEMNDVKASVITDYQAQLEDAWLKELAAKYPAKVNKKVLKQVKTL